MNLTGISVPGAGPITPSSTARRRGGNGRTAQVSSASSTSELLTMAELHLALGTAGVVDRNVSRMLCGYRALVRTWLTPHLADGPADEPCEGCAGHATRASCPYVATFRSTLANVFAEALATAGPTSPSTDGETNTEPPSGPA